jgi:hypothetical protein
MLDTDDEISSAVQAILDARPTFKVGDRVRTRLDGECQVLGEPNSPLALAGAKGHVPDEDGRLGTVDLVHVSPVGALAFLAEQGHTVCVLFDEAVLVGGRWCRGGYFAPTELEPLP